MAKEEKREETMGVPGKWSIDMYTWRIERHLEEFTKGLKEKRIIGSLCPSCGRVYVPPKYICGRCFTKITERIDVSDIGAVTTFIIGGETEKGGLESEAGLKREEKYERPIIVNVKFDGADTGLLGFLKGIKPEDVRIGMNVQAVWKDKPEGNLSDIEYFEPIQTVA